jgi:hypothetical protein
MLGTAKMNTGGVFGSRGGDGEETGLKLIYLIIIYCDVVSNVDKSVKA